MVPLSGAMTHTPPFTGINSTHLKSWRHVTSRQLAASPPTQTSTFSPPLGQTRELVEFFARTEKLKKNPLKLKANSSLVLQTRSWEDMRLLVFPTKQCLRKQEVGLEVTWRPSFSPFFFLFFFLTSCLETRGKVCFSASAVHLSCRTPIKRTRLYYYKLPLAISKISSRPINLFRR